MDGKFAGKNVRSGVNGLSVYKIRFIPTFVIFGNQFRLPCQN